MNQLCPTHPSLFRVIPTTAGTNVLVSLPIFSWLPRAEETEIPRARTGGVLFQHSLQVLSIQDGPATTRCADCHKRGYISCLRSFYHLDIPGILILGMPSGFVLREPYCYVVTDLLGGPESPSESCHNTPSTTSRYYWRFNHESCCIMLGRKPWSSSSSCP